MTKFEQKTFRKALAIGMSPPVLERIQQAGDRDSAGHRMREVRAALRRIDEGAFGICADCGEAINPERLADTPWAPYCVVCQEATDQERVTPAHWFDSSAFMAA